jgi:hypothetical protein
MEFQGRNNGISIRSKDRQMRGVDAKWRHLQRRGSKDRARNVYALDGKIVGHFDGDGLAAAPGAFARLFPKAVRN